MEKKDFGVDVAELFVRAGLVKSKSEARKQILNGGLRVNDIKITDPHARVIADKKQVFILQKDS